MTIQAGDRLPDATLFESLEFGEACPISPEAGEGRRRRARASASSSSGFPGAFTPTCSAKHVPGYLANFDALKAKGVDEVWCVSVNDGYVMAAWGREQKAIGKIRFLGDGTADFTKKLGLDVDLPGMGIRMQRCSMLVDDGVVKQRQRRADGQVRGLERGDDARSSCAE